MLYMKKIVLSLWILLGPFISPISIASIPDDIIVLEHWISATKSYDIKTSNETLGTLYRRFFTYPMTYDFYDSLNLKTATARAQWFTWGTNLDIYDQSGEFIGSVKEKLLTVFSTFEIIAKDNSTQLLKAEMNFWGTKFYIYDPITNEEIATMSRPYFRVKNDWVIKVTNHYLLEQKNIDPRIFYTVVAAQGEIEDWEKKNKNLNLTNNQIIAEESQKFLQELDSLNVELGFNASSKFNSKTIETLIEDLEKSSNTEHPKVPYQSNAEKIKNFYQHCLNLLHSETLTLEQKKELLSLLRSHLGKLPAA